MLRYVLAAAGAVVAACSPTLAKAATLVELAPSSPWHIDASEEACTLERAFGQDAAQVFLRMVQFGPFPFYRVELIGDRFRSRELHKQVRFTVEPLGTLTVGSLAGQLTDGRPALNFGLALSHPFETAAKERQPLDPSEEARITEIRIGQVGGGGEVVLKVGGMGPVFNAMRGCMDRLLAHWGVDQGVAPAEKGTLAKAAMPRGSPGDWIRSSDYPTLREALRESGLVHFRLRVGPDGRVADCVIQQATRGKEFSERTCELIRKRAMFDPARDHAGKPTTGHYFNSVAWLAQVPR